MKKQEKDILKILIEEPIINLRILAEASHHSLDVID